MVLEVEVELLVVVLPAVKIIVAAVVATSMVVGARVRAVARQGVGVGKQQQQ